MTEQRKRERPEPLRKSFALFERARGLVELQCPGCGTTIGKVLPVGEQRVRRVKTQTFIETMMQFCYLAPYREVELDMLDADSKVGTGKHVSCACVTCAERLRADPVFLTRFKETDLAQWRSEGHTITEQMDRRPKGVLRVADFIRD